MGGGAPDLGGSDFANQQLTDESIRRSRQAAGIEQLVAAGLIRDANQTQSREQFLEGQLRQDAQFARDFAKEAGDEGRRRRAEEMFILRGQQGTPGQVGTLGNELRAVSDIGTGELAGLGRMFQAGDRDRGLLSQAALLAQGGINTQQNIPALAQLSQNAGQLGATGGLGGTQQVQQVGQNLGDLARSTGQQLGPLRGQTLGLLGQAIQGNVPQQVQNLFADAGATRERDVLELQFANAERAIREGAAGQGGQLNRSLANLQTERALGIAGQEARRTNQERALSQALFNTAVSQGLGAPGQLSALLGQQAGVFQGAGQLGLGAEGLRQGAVGLGGQLQGQIGQQLLGAEGARQGALGLSGQLFGQSEQLRQAGLRGAIGAMDTALGRDFQGILAQQASLAQQQALAQSLAGQIGAGADQLFLSAPGFRGQGATFNQQAALTPALSAQVLQGISQSNPNFLGPALASTSQNIASGRQLAAQNAAGFNQLLGTGIGAGAGLAGLAFFT